MKPLSENLHYYAAETEMPAEALNQQILKDWSDIAAARASSKYIAFPDVDEPDKVLLCFRHQLMSLFDINTDLFWRIERLEKEVADLRAKQKD